LSTRTTSAPNCLALIAAKQPAKPPPTIKISVFISRVDIIDIDHMVPSIDSCASLLNSYQVFSGKSDPVTIIQNGTYNSILDSVRSDFIASKGRCIISAGCEITPETGIKNMQYFKKTVFSLIESLEQR